MYAIRSYYVSQSADFASAFSVVADNRGENVIIKFTDQADSECIRITWNDEYVKITATVKQTGHFRNILGARVAVKIGTENQDRGFFATAGFFELFKFLFAYTALATDIPGIERIKKVCMLFFDLFRYKQVTQQRQ